VVQRRKGLWLHRAGVGSGRVCPLHGDPGRRLPQPGRGRHGGVRGRAGSQGLAGAERPQGLTDLRIADRAGSGIPRARFFPGDYIGPMRALHFACSSLLLPVVLAAQAPPVYRGFSPGMAYRDFATRAQGVGTWEGKNGRRVARLNWRGRGGARWIYINLADNDLMDGISRYVKTTTKRKP